MKRQTGTLTSILVLLVLFAGLSLAQQRAKEKPQPKFEPAQVLSTTDVVYPIASIAFGPVALEVTVGENGEIGRERPGPDGTRIVEQCLTPQVGL